MFSVLAQHLRSPIGIDVGSRFIKAAQLTRIGDGWRVACAANVQRAGTAGIDIAPFATADEAARLLLALHRQGFTGNEVVLGAPSSKLLTSVLDVPASRGTSIPMEQITRSEMARAHRCAADSFEMGYWDLPSATRASKGAQVMAVACPHADAESALNAFDSAGATVLAMDAEACALARACAPLACAAPAITAILDVGWSRAALLLIHHGVPIYSRILHESGIGRLHGAFASHLRLGMEVADYLLEEMCNAPRPGAAGEPRPNDVPAEARSALSSHVEAMAHELIASFGYAQHQYADSSIGRLLLVGGGASLLDLSASLQKHTEIEAVAASPSALGDRQKLSMEAAASPALMTAIGLAQFGGD